MNVGGTKSESETTGSFRKARAQANDRRASTMGGAQGLWSVVVAAALAWMAISQVRNPSVGALIEKNDPAADLRRPAEIFRATP